MIPLAVDVTRCGKTGATCSFWDGGVYMRENGNIFPFGVSSPVS